MNVDADEEQSMFQDGHINAGGDEKTIVQDAMEERVEEDHVRQDPELEVVVQQKAIMEVTKRIPGQVNTMSNVHLNDNLSFWEGHQVYSSLWICYITLRKNTQKRLSILIPKQS